MNKWKHNFQDSTSPLTGSSLKQLTTSTLRRTLAPTSVELGKKKFLDLVPTPESPSSHCSLNQASHLLQISHLFCVLYIGVLLYKSLSGSTWDLKGWPSSWEFSLFLVLEFPWHVEILLLCSHLNYYFQPPTGLSRSPALGSVSSLVFKPTFSHWYCWVFQDFFGFHWGFSSSLYYQKLPGAF